jgi:hypothetical protein
MGKRPAGIGPFVGNMGSIQWEDTAFYATRRSASHDNGTRADSSESSHQPKPPVHFPGASYHTGSCVGGVGAHNAVATLHEIVSGRNVEWVLKADLKNFFGSLDQGWLLRFVEHRVGDPRILSLIRRWLKAGILEDGEIHPNEKGTPHGGSISVLLSNLYLHYVLDLWFQRVVRPRLRGEAYMVRYIDDFVLCFQYRADALRVQDVLRKRLEKFELALEPTKTKLVEFGRFAQTHAAKPGRKRPETIYFLGFTLYCATNHHGNFQVGLRTEKSRLKRGLAHYPRVPPDIRRAHLARSSADSPGSLRRPDQATSLKAYAANPHIVVVERNLTCAELTKGACLMCKPMFDAVPCDGPADLSRIH